MFKVIEIIIWVYRVHLAVVKYIHGYFGKGMFCIESIWQVYCKQNCQWRQCNIQWYVYNNKVAHVSEEMITRGIDITKKQFWELVVSRGNKHTFLGMDIELVKGGKINIGMKSYIK